MYHGDIRLGDTIDIKFSTRAFATGAPTTLAGSPVISAYVGNGTTEITAGITLTVDFDARTGLHNVRVVASSGNGYATATNVALVITTGTVGGVSVVGEVIGSFSIECRLPLTVGSVTGAVGSVTGAVGSVTGAVGSVTGMTASDVGAIKAKTDSLPASPASTTNITAGTITTVTNLTNAPTAGDLTATMKASVTAAVPTAAVIADAVLDEDMTGHQTQGTLGQAIGDPVADTNTIFKAVVTDAAGANIGVDIVALKAETAAILVDTGTTLQGELDAIQTNVDAILVDTGTTLDGKINTIDTVVDSILVDTAEIGAAGAGLTAINLPNQTMDIVGNITGNLSGSVGSVTGAVGSVTAGVTLAAAAIQAIWDALTSALTTAGSIGKLLVDNINGTISSRASQTSVDDLPTNAELATSQAAADDATLAAIAALNNLSSAQAQTAAEAALAVYDPPTRTEATADKDAILTAVADVPTNAELATALAASDDAVLAQVALVKTVTDKLDDTLEDDAGTFRFTANALEQGPGGGSAPTAAAIADAVWDEAMADHLTGGSTGSSLNGAGAAGDPWTTPLPGAYGAGTAGKIIGDNVNASISSRASQSSVDDIPTNAELATSQALSDDDTLAAIAALNNLSAAGVRAAVGLATANLDTQLEDIPTNSELATSQAAADDATLAAIAALNNLSAAGVRAALGLATANLDTQLADLPTNAELATSQGSSDDATLAAIAALNNLSEANIRIALGLAAANLDTQLSNIAQLADSIDAYQSHPTTGFPLIYDQVALVKAKTDNLPSDPADQSILNTALISVLSAIEALNNIPAGSPMTLTVGERNAIATAYLDMANAIEVGLTVRGAMRLGAAADAGKTSGMESATNVIRNAIADSKPRITATTDEYGNRSAVEVDVT